jgi:hypothetical protein
VLGCWSARRMHVRTDGEVRLVASLGHDAQLMFESGRLDVTCDDSVQLVVSEIAWRGE